MFPHHEAEIAQAEAITGLKPFVRYWIHVGLLTVEGKKMSKSIGNVVTIREAFKKYDANTIRLFILSTHYRSPLDFRWELLDSAAKSVSRLITAVSRLKQLDIVETTQGSDEEKLVSEAKETMKGFVDSMNSDLNTAAALSHVFKLANAVNDFTNKHSRISKDGFGEVYRVFKDAFDILGLKVEEEVSTDITDLICLIVDVRSKLRVRKMWDLADEIRAKLKELGIELQDTTSGTRWILRKRRT